MRARALFVIMAMLAAAACGKDKGDQPRDTPEADQGSTQGQATDQATGPKADEPAPAGPGAGFDLAAMAARLQGAWVVGGSTIGLREAWQVQGDEVTIWNGQQEKTLEFAVTSPCTVKATERGADGSSSSTISVFVFDGDTLYKGLGSAGFRQGDVLVASMGGSVYTYQGGACTRWDESMFGGGKWDSKDAECTLQKQGEAEVFEVAGPRGGSIQTWPGETGPDVFMTRQMAGNKADKLATWDQAKAALPAK